MNVSDLLIGGSAWWILPVSLLVFGASFGLMPGLMLRLIVLLYPKDDLRRTELFAELYAPEMGRFKRFEWVFQQLETAAREGLPARVEARHKRRLPKKKVKKRKIKKRVETGGRSSGYLVDVVPVDVEIEDVEGRGVMAASGEVTSMTHIRDELDRRNMPG